MEVKNIWLEAYRDIHKKAYEISMIKPVPSEWIEENIILSEGVSRYKGPMSYRYSPYAAEIVNTISSDHPARAIAVMKGAQIGITQGVIVPGMAYVIAKDAAPMLFMAADKELASKSIQERFEPIMQDSGLQELIRPSVVRAKNQRTGDTSTSKEYAGGRLTVEGTKNVDKMRQISVKIVFADDWEAAPRSDKSEGSLRKLIEARQTSYGNLAKTYYVSTPTLKNISNIEPIYELGDKRKWFWKCPFCENHFTPEWRTELEEGGYAGIVWKLDSDNMLIKESVKYKCPHCLELIPERYKYEMNLAGFWKPTAKPKIENYYSYYINSLCCPPGFLTWADLAQEWIEACPIGMPVKKYLLQAFMNTRLGLTWEEKGETLKVNKLMENTREYSVGIIPDVTSEEDGNGSIILLTLACDLNGIMNRDITDVRLDWELKAHAANGQCYSVEHGSIGTFSRIRDVSKKDINKEQDREKYTFDLGKENSVWNEFENIMRRSWRCESGSIRDINLTLVDTGYFTNLANKFISSIDDLLIFGIKGRSERNYRDINKDTKLVSLSTESKNLYIVEVNQVKDIVSENMKLPYKDDGTQPEGFMNFPMPSDGLYTMKSYFSHFEGERRMEDIKDGEVVGFKWEKIHSGAKNHFWDVHIYNYAAKDIYLNVLKRTDPKNFKDITWADLVAMVS